MLDTIKGLASSLGDTAPSLKVGLIPAGNAALAQLLDPAVQGSHITVSMGCIDILTGLVIGTPLVLFEGELDVPTVDWGPNDRRIEYSIGGIGERLFMTEEAIRLSDTWHQHVWPGELGLSLVTDVETWVPWGQKIDMTAIQTRTNLPGMGAITGART